MWQISQKMQLPLLQPSLIPFLAALPQMLPFRGGGGEMVAIAILFFFGNAHPIWESDSEKLHFFLNLQKNEIKELWQPWPSAHTLEKEKEEGGCHNLYPTWSGQFLLFLLLHWKGFHFLLLSLFCACVCYSCFCCTLRSLQSNLDNYKKKKIGQIIPGCNCNCISVCMSVSLPWHSRL